MFCQTIILYHLLPPRATSKGEQAKKNLAILLDSGVKSHVEGLSNFFVCWGGLLHLPFDPPSGWNVCVVHEGPLKPASTSLTILLKHILKTFLPDPCHWSWHCTLSVFISVLQVTVSGQHSAPPELPNVFILPSTPDTCTLISLRLFLYSARVTLDLPFTYLTWFFFPALLVFIPFIN